MTAPLLSITLLGEFSLTLANKPAANFVGDRPVSLLAYLLLHRRLPQLRQQIAFTFWPDSSDSQARANLRNLFYTLRQTIPQADSYLAADSMTLQWRSDAEFTLDVAEFEEALAAAKTVSSALDKINSLESAVLLYKGDLLPNIYDDWIGPLREELRQNYLDALHQLVSLLEQQQDYRSAIRYNQRFLQQDPLDEAAYVQLMRLHALNGDRAGVRRAYETCVAALRRELDVEPGSPTQAAYEQLVRLEIPVRPGSPPDTPVQPRKDLPIPPRPRPLPVPVTPFIGREDELAHIAELLANPDCRLVTIVGSGGMGKTRLALETAVGHQGAFADGAVWVPLVTVQTANQVATAIAEALQFRLGGKTNATAELINVLEHKQMLIVLDNFEHLLAATDFLTAVLAQAVAVKFLVTSRQVLSLQQEWRFELEALPLPDEPVLDTPATNSAILLFEQSARRTAGTLSLSVDDYAAIARICHLVDGIPLGIELAASWVRLLSCAEIAQEIEKSLDFLTVSLRDMPPRHRSLRAVFDYSWNLLSPLEQEALVRLSVFRGGFTREAAVQVAAADLQLLSALADHSFVQRTAVGRYSLHNIVKQYAADHLQANPDARQDAARQHSIYYLQWLAEMDDALRSSGQGEALITIALELANIRAAWQHAVNTQNIGLLQSASFALFYFYELRGLIQEGETVFCQSADTLEADPINADREMQIAICNLRTNQGYFAVRLGQMAAAETALRQVIAQLQRLADDTVLSYSLRYLGLVVLTNGYFEEAGRLFRQSLDLSLRYHRDWETAISQAYLGSTAYHQGLMTAAQQYLEMASANNRQLGDPRLTVYTLMQLGRTNLALGHLAEAQKQLEESLILAGQTNDRYSIDTVRLHLGLVKQAQGDLPAARQLLQDSIESYSRTGDLVGAQRAQVSMGFLEITAGDTAAAKNLFQTVLQSERHEPGKKYIFGALIGLANLRAAAGDLLTAMSWVFSVLDQPTLDWEAKELTEALRVDLEARLSADELATAQAQAAQESFSTILAAACRS